ncbi:hypothetical protein BaRGS_00017048 [Batillaria attramentaria]|uniref:Uncharacterized protein n=1 Tax=Batillaria attramentaria TaxID=370345 RepID=A0ABD0KX40_9CAEN
MRIAQQTIQSTTRLCDGLNSVEIWSLTHQLTINTQPYGHFQTFPAKFDLLQPMYIHTAISCHGLGENPQRLLRLRRGKSVAFIKQRNITSMKEYQCRGSFVSDKYSHNGHTTSSHEIQTNNRTDTKTGYEHLQQQNFTDQPMKKFRTDITAAKLYRPVKKFRTDITAAKLYRTVKQFRTDITAAKLYRTVKKFRTDITAAKLYRSEKVQDRHRRQKSYTRSFDILTCVLCCCVIHER